MPAVTVNGVDLHYVDEGHGEPVLFVHGGVGDYRVWERQMDAFGPDYRTVALSCRGSWPNAPLRPDAAITLDTFVADLAQFIRVLGAGPVHMVGHSSPGGFAGLRLALQHPELLRTLVLLEPPAFPLLGVNIPPRPAQILRLLLRHPRAGIAFINFGTTGVRPAIRAFQRGNDAEGLKVFLGANTDHEAVDAIPPAMFQRFLDNVGPLKAQLKSGFPPFGPAEASAICVPTLLVSGARSPAHLNAVTNRLSALIPQVETLTIPDATHHMFHSHPDQFNAGVLRFLRSHSLAAR